MTDTATTISGDPANWACALLLAAAWLVASWRCLRARPAGTGMTADCLIVFASQTGHAQDLARHTHSRLAPQLEPRGRSCVTVAANDLTVDMLHATDRIFFVLATTGDGEAPDNARRFDTGLLVGKVDLAGKRIAVLALGDRRYRHFCRFGHKVADWARRCGADVATPVCVDDLSTHDLSGWNELLTQEGFVMPGTEVAEDLPRWTIASRDQVAAPSFCPAGQMTTDGLYHLVLRADRPRAATWQIGDLFELTTPDGHVRDYSIANLPGDGAIHLFVRRVLADGRPGRGSGLLTGAEPDTTYLSGRIRQHCSFRPPAGAGPLLAIGAGSGWAGLRPHLLHAMAEQRPCWLIFGERDGASAVLHEMRRWQDDGRLQRLDLAISRAGGGYVQHVLGAQRTQVARFLQHGVDGGAIVLCGQLSMGRSTLEILADTLGPRWLEQARNTGRLRHDFY